MSTYEKKLSVGSLTAGADLSAKLHHLVKVHTVANQVNTCGAGEEAIGVLLNEPTSGAVAEVSRGIIVPVIAGAAVSIGARLMSNAAGRAIAATSTNRVVGIALEAASADGEEIRMVFGAGLTVEP